jgi:hypothetical protein
VCGSCLRDDGGVFGEVVCACLERGGLGELVERLAAAGDADRVAGLGREFVEQALEAVAGLAGWGASGLGFCWAARERVAFATGSGATGGCSSLKSRGAQAARRCQVR